MWAFKKKAKDKFYKRLLDEHNFLNLRDGGFFLQMPAGLQRLEYTLRSDAQQSGFQVIGASLYEEGTFNPDEIKSLCASYEKDEARLYICMDATLPWKRIGATDFISVAPRVLLFIHPDVSISGDLMEFATEVDMSHVFDRELFVLPDGFEITLTEQKVVDTPFYTQRRSKLVKGDNGKLFCSLGLQFNKMTVPSYDSLVYQKLKNEDPSHVLVESSLADFHFLCAVCNVDAFAVNTQDYAILFHLMQVAQQVLLHILDDKDKSDLANQIVQVLLTCVWHRSSNRLRLRYAEGRMRGVSATIFDNNTPDELAYGKRWEYTLDHFTEMVCSGPSSKKAKYDVEDWRDNEPEDITLLAEDLRGYFKLEAKSLKDRSSPHTVGTWKITKLSTRVMTLEKLRSKTTECKTEVGIDALREVYSLTKKYDCNSVGLDALRSK
jgi:hypothetical protein